MADTDDLVAKLRDEIASNKRVMAALGASINYQKGIAETATQRLADLRNRIIELAHT